MAIVPEGRRLLPDLSVDDNIKVATYALSKQDAAEGRARALELFPRLGERLTVPARLLSGGEQQMVVLAQALVSQPKYILIDELSLGLAPVIVNQLIPVIRSVAASGVGMLLIEQFATVALSLATGAHVMEGGVLRYSGTAAELKEQPGPAAVRVPAARVRGRGERGARRVRRGGARRAVRCGPRRRIRRGGPRRCVRRGSRRGSRRGGEARITPCSRRPAYDAPVASGP